MASIGAGWVLPLPRNTIGRRIEVWFAGVVEMTRANFQDRPRRAAKEYHHPRREVFLEDAAMSREMYRL
jgi:hypothetical protein